LRAAELSGADLRGVSLSHAAMQRADLTFVRLDGARLEKAQLPNANLYKAQLSGAHLSGTQLQGADLTMAQLQGAQLRFAQLQGADLTRAQLQGDRLSDAQLQGTNLEGAQLQGANLTGAGLADSDFDGTFVFRSSIPNTNFVTAAIRSVHADQVKSGANGKTAPLQTFDVDAWIGAATQLARVEHKEAITKRFDRLKNDFQAPDQDAKDVLKWKSLEDSYLSSDPDGAHHRQRLAKFLADLACEPDAGAPYVARGLIHNRRLEALGDQLEGVRARMKAARGKPDACKGVAGFTDDDWRRLDAIKPIEAPQADH